MEKGQENCNVESIRTLIRYWSHKNMVSIKRMETNRDAYDIRFKVDYEILVNKFKDRIKYASKVLNYLISVHKKHYSNDGDGVKPDLIRFSLLDLKTHVEKDMFTEERPLTFYEKVLLYLQEIGAVKLEGGLLIAYIPFNITRVEKSNLKQFTKEDYKKLKDFYEHKVEQIHIVGEYAKKIIRSYQEAMEFVDNYFRMEYKKFINKYFPDRKTEIKRPLTDKKFKELFGMLSTGQLEVIKDNENKHILVAAGPGSGKTRILVHKIASLLLMEDIKAEQFLMLTFSRPACMELKNRLAMLVEKTSYYIDIFTYHSYAFNLLGRIGRLEKADTIIKEATEAMMNEEISREKLDVKSVIVVDEYQDISEEEFQFLTAIIKKAEDVRIIVVGDDDQNIYEFRGSSVKYMRDFREKYNAVTYYLDINFRSKANIVHFANQFLNLLSDRIKNKASIRANTDKDGIIQIKKYRSENLILPLTEHISSLNLKGTTAVLTVTNEEAMLIETVLKQKGIAVKLILAGEGFRLKNLIEIRYFTHFISQKVSDEFGLITEKTWTEGKDKIKEVFQRSNKLDLALKVIYQFEKENKRKFKSDWKEYLEEIKTEEFYFPENEVILVSTMHKAKGKEFDNVFIMLDNYRLMSDEKKRVLYVAITRAKENLFIHTNQSYFDGFSGKNFSIIEDNKEYDKPEKFVLQLSLTDIKLWHHKRNSRKALSRIMAGDKLRLINSDLLQDNNNLVSLRFSGAFRERHIKKFMEKGYVVEDIEVGYVVIWKDKEDDSENRIILPKIFYIRQNTAREIKGEELLK